MFDFFFVLLISPLDDMNTTNKCKWSYKNRSERQTLNNNTAAVVSKNNSRELSVIVEFFYCIQKYLVMSITR